MRLRFSGVATATAIGLAALVSQGWCQSAGEGDPFTRAARMDSIYRAWMMPDSEGVRRYWFRKEFVIEDLPSSGKVWITADDNYSLYLNGTYIAEDGHAEMDWMKVDEYDVGNYIVQGRNVIALEVADVDSTRRGVILALEYETIPDINRELDKMVERELAEQERRREEALKAKPPVTVPRPQEQPTHKGPSPEQLHQFRAVKKNKLD